MGMWTLRFPIFGNWLIFQTCLGTFCTDGFDIPNQQGWNFEKLQHSAGRDISLMLCSMQIIPISPTCTKPPGRHSWRIWITGLCIVYVSTYLHTFLSIFHVRKEIWRRWNHHQTYTTTTTSHHHMLAEKRMKIKKIQLLVHAKWSKIETEEKIKYAQAWRQATTTKTTTTNDKNGQKASCLKPVSCCFWNLDANNGSSSAVERVYVKLMDVRCVMTAHRDMRFGMVRTELVFGEQVFQWLT
jgi:hypothetical protein